MDGYLHKQVRNQYRIDLRVDLYFRGLLCSQQKLGSACLRSHCYCSVRSWTPIAHVIL